MMKLLRIVFFIASVYGQSDVYWGSYELNIPGGSGSGNAVHDLKLPENAPEFFQFAAFNGQPFAAPQFNPVPQPAPQPAPRPAPQSTRPVPTTVLRPAQQPSSQPALQVRPAPQPQQLRVFQSQPTNRQQQRPAQIRQPAPQPSQPKQQAVQAVQPTQRFQNFAPRTEERRPAPAVQAQPSVEDNEVDTEKLQEEPTVDVSNLSRFQLYQLRQKLSCKRNHKRLKQVILQRLLQ
eukprot:TRINITY_DN9882_c0_g1_i1.p1 TRINITY_DN9882_c0_g1~~TRINITY_DN9882_c0_g1_i1.p1  ORF type:complete len:234 (-),score=50.83 TRINITY_DN9882_c0_g1_i1:288-989(-)